MKLGQRTVIHVGRRRHHQILGLAVHREQDDLANVRLVGDQHHHAVDAGRDTAVRRRAEAEGVDHRRELFIHHAVVIAGNLERLVHHLGQMVPDRAR